MTPTGLGRGLMEESVPAPHPPLPAPRSALGPRRPWRQAARGYLHDGVDRGFVQKILRRGLLDQT